jgi:HEAT repeat protein
MGTNAVPFLIETLERKPSKLGEAVDKQRADHPGSIPESVAKVLPSAYRVEDRREMAAFFLGELGPLAEAAIPTLLRICCDTNENSRVQGQAWSALPKMGEKGAVLVPDYLRWLKGNDPELQETGASFLGSVGPKARVAIPELLKAAVGTNAGLARTAALALWSIDRQTNVALRIHTKDLQSTNSSTRQLAAVYLGKMGAAAAEAAPQIEPLLRDPDDQVRDRAENALGEIAPDLLVSSQHRMNQDSEAQIARLIQIMREGEYPQRYRAVEAIGVFGPAAKAAVPALVEALEGFVPATGFLASVSKRNSQRVVADALGEIGPEARSAVPGLIARLGENSGYDERFCKALGRIGPEAREAGPVLENLLQDGRPGIRIAAAEALTRIVPSQCSNAVTVLKTLQHDPQLATVWRSDGRGAATQSSESDFDNPESRFFRLAACVPLWKFGIEKQSPVPALIAELHNGANTNPLNRDDLRYIELLGEVGPEAAPALPILTKYLEVNKGIKLRRTAANTIRKISPEEAAKLNLPGVLAIP